MPPRTAKQITDQDVVNFSKHKEDIRIASEQAKDIITREALSASQTIAGAAELAAKAIASAAEVAVRVVSVKNADDHDLLIKLNTLMDGLKEDIRDLKSGTSMKIDDHESRIKTLENRTSNYTITLALYTLAVAAMISLILYHIFKTP